MVSEQEQIIRLLKTARGQIDGIIKMIDDNAYCINVSNQILAVQGILKKSNMKVLENHMKHCVRDAFHNHENEEEKIKEIMMILEKYTK